MISSVKINLVLKVIASLIFLLVIINLIIIDIAILHPSFTKTEEGNIKVNFAKDKEISLNQKSENCSNSCLREIFLATTSSKTNQTTYIPSSTQQSINYSPVKEFFISLGSGSNSTDDWADVTGAQVYVDSSRYTNMKKVTFEASVHIPTGNEKAYVRLFNATDKHPVWFSEVSLDGGTPRLLISDPITLDSGNKLYQVQMKTSLKYQAVLDQARIHIVTY